MGHDVTEGLLKRRILRDLLISMGIACIAAGILVLRFFHPYHRPIALMIYALSWLPLAWSFRTKKSVIRQHSSHVKQRIKPYLLHIVVAAGLLVIGRAAWLLAPPVVTPLGHIAHGDLEFRLHADLDSLRILESNRRALADWANGSNLFGRSLDSLTSDEKQRVLEFWYAVLNTTMELEVIKTRYRGFYQIDPLIRPDLHADAFIAAFGAFLNQYALSLQVANCIDESPFMATMLNDAHPAQSIPKDSFHTLKRRLTHPTQLLRLNAGVAYWALIRDSSDAGQTSDMDGLIKIVYRELGQRPTRIFEAPLDLLEKTASAAWFPFQKDIAVRMSEIRTRQRPYLIGPDLLQQHAAALRPGDILLQRRNWHVTNVGIPGFWSHSALYLGTPDELDKDFGDHVAASNRPSAILAQAFPDVTAQWRQPAENGNPRRVIEALRDGVLLTDLETSANCDYLAVLRPRLPPAARFQALRNALSHVGKPYDFSFDFAVDSALVCSELIVKAFLDLPDFGFDLTVVNGRLMLPPNLIAKKFDTEFDKPDRHLDLILFLDASERRGAAFIGTEPNFRTSWQRPRWEPLLD